MRGFESLREQGRLSVDCTDDLEKLFSEAAGDPDLLVGETDGDLDQLKTHPGEDPDLAEPTGDLDLESSDPPGDPGRAYTESDLDLECAEAVGKLDCAEFDVKVVAEPAA